MYFLGVCLAIVLLIFGTSRLYDSHASASYTPPAVTLHEASLGADINAILSQNNDLDVSISVTDIQTGKNCHYGENAGYTAASIGKLVTATAYLHQVELGNTSLDSQVGGLTAREQLTLLIEQSDNTAWQVLNDALTKDGLQQYAYAAGLTSYEPESNTVTSNDIALLLDKLAGQKLLDTEHTSFLLGLMQAANMRDYIVAAVPAGTTVYHKVGYLADRLHEAAIIQRGNRSYVLVVFSKSAGDYDFSRGATVFQAITKATLQAFFF